MRRTLEGYVGEKERQRTLLDEISSFGRRHRQLGLFLFIYYWYALHGHGADFRRLWRFYNSISDHVVHENTVRKQLKLLENKGLVEERGGKYYPKVSDLEAAAAAFDVERSRAGKMGARRAFRQYIYRGRVKPLALPKQLKGYVRRIAETAVRLVERGRREAALDLIVHTLLPVRESGVLWLWRGDEFIYYESKVGAKGEFHSARSQLLADFLKSLGFREGLMIYHVRGHDAAKKIIRKLFGRGYMSWPWARSIFYALKKYGLAGEGNYYILEHRYENGIIYLYLKDYYGNIVNVYEYLWPDEASLPPPANRERQGKFVVIGKQHVKDENEESYFSRW
jgi:hypothetical protein